MNRKSLLILILPTLLACLFHTRFGRTEAKALGGYPVHNLNTGLNYDTIQEAIDANETMDGHVIHVDAGTFIDHVTVNKSVSLIGEGRDSTIIRGSIYPNPLETVFYIAASNVTINSFTIRDGMFGVQTRADYTAIVNCTISNNMDAIASLYSYGGNIITGNIIRDNTVFGISMYTNDNIISANTIINNSLGINLQGVGFPVHLPVTGTIVVGNNITSNNVGCNLYEADNNTFHDNCIAGNDVGCQPYFSNNNTFSHNNFINNKVQASCPNCTNTWDDSYPSGGNYWSGYGGSDVFFGPYQNLTGSDGIGDIPYVIDENNVDNYPLMSPYEYWSDPIPGDVNKDKQVSMEDIIEIVDSFGSVKGSEGYYWHKAPCTLCPHCLNLDIDKNNQIDMGDIIIACDNFGKSHP